MLAHYAGGLGSIRRIIQYKYKVGDRPLLMTKKSDRFVYYLSLLTAAPRGLELRLVMNVEVRS